MDIISLILFTYYLWTLISIYFSEGDHLYIDYVHSNWKKVLHLLPWKVEELDYKVETSMVILRDVEEDVSLNKIFHEQGFIKVAMPNSAVMENLAWNFIDEYIDKLSPRSRKHFMKEIKPYEEKFEIVLRMTYVEIKARKGSKTEYFEELMVKLHQKINIEDSV